MSICYPVALDLTDRRCLLVGGGAIADGKVDGLLAAGARLTIVSPTVTQRIATLADAGRLTLHRRPYQTDDVTGAFLVIAATDDRATNALIARDGRTIGALVNAVDDPPNCDFFAVSIVRRGDLQIAVSTNGRSPAFARWLRERLDTDIPEAYGPLLDVLADARQALRTIGPIPPYESWQAAITDDVLAAIERGDDASARSRILDQLATPAATATSALEGGNG